MVNPQLKKRKIVVLGSRSVGEHRFLEYNRKIKPEPFYLGKSSLVKQFIEVFKRFFLSFFLINKKVDSRIIFFTEPLC